MNDKSLRVWALTAVLLAAGCASKPAPKPVEPKPVAVAVVGGVEKPAPDIKMGDPLTIERIIDQGKNHNQVMTHLTYLCTQIGPRLTGSSNAETANRWALEQFKTWGLSNGYLDEWGTIAVRFDRGPSTGRALRKDENKKDDGTVETTWKPLRDFEFTTLAWAAGTPGPVRGQVVKFPKTEEEFDAIKDKVAGAWVLIGPDAKGQGIRGTTGQVRARLATLNDRRKAKDSGAAEKPKDEPAPPAAPAAPTRYTGRTEGGNLPAGGIEMTLDLDAAADHTASGAVNVPGYHAGPIKDGKFDPDAKLYTFAWDHPAGTSTFSLTLDGGTLAGSAERGDEKYTVALQAAEQPAQAEKPPEPEGPSLLERVFDLGPAGWLSSSGDERVWTSSAQGWRELDFAAIPPDVEVTIRQPDYDFLNSRVYDGQDTWVEFDLKNQFTKGPIPCYNTVAEIRGSVRPDEVVIISGHLDSWNGPGSQGTLDNGQGSAVTMEAARILIAAGAKPDRTIRFILWTGEEQGLLGSRSYVDRNAAELPRISAVFVDDGGSNYDGGLKPADVMVDYLAAATAPVNNVFYSETDGKYLNVNIQPAGAKISTHGGSDHWSFYQKGVPGFFWDETGRSDYGRGWHTQYDRIDLAVPEYLRQASTCAAITAYNLACAPDLLPRELKEPEQPKAEGQ